MSDAHAPMAERGAGRPSMEMDGHHQEMTAGQRDDMLVEHHRRTLWVPLLLALLGVWMLSSPFTLGYTNLEPGPDLVRVTEERQLDPVETRALRMAWSDGISGLLLAGLGLAWAAKPRRPVLPWAGCAVGIWLLFAPVLLWSPSAAGYANATVVGALVIALTILIPGMPGMIRIMRMGPEIPPGWSYNPSSWLQRAPIIALGWVGFFFARYLAAYQLGYTDYAVDPFFGEDTVEILDSDVSRAWPISDAGLGVVAYTLEALMGYMGGTSRWRTMPWMVAFFGILVVPLGAVSIFLVIMQPLAVGAWSTIALITAAAMLVMIPLTLDEVVAMGQFVLRKRREGAGLWRTFIYGDTVDGGGDDDRSPSFPPPAGRAAAASVWGVSVSWTLLASAAIGIWLMAAPAVLGSDAAAADSDHLVGALVVCVAVIAAAELARAMRFLNIAFGVWLLAAPWLLEGAGAAGVVSNMSAGVALLALSLPKGPISERYGTAERFIR